MERKLEALRDRASPRLLVMRKGEWRRISGREMVHGGIPEAFWRGRLTA
ncbi:MAG: hypothetical protein L0Y50_13835 [Beijerinckiaceae bacterium]|nr:hypothetical protein [Beijerinckiaceae bacterium]MCI0737327.1 hypothetical protein [Beijerinckiaceae bacterium]